MSGEEPKNQDSLSQEDIDAALASMGGDAPDASAAPEEAAKAPAAETPAEAPEQTDAQAETPTEASTTPAAESNAPFSQDDIDAVLSGATSETSAAAATPATPAAPQAIDQSDIDAVLAAAEGAQDAGGTLDQDDIDATMAAAEAAVAEETMVKAAGDAAKTAPAPPAAEVKLDSAGRPFDEAAAMMEAAIAEERAAAAAAAAQQASQPMPPPPIGSRPIEMPDLSSVDAGGTSEQSIELLNDVELDVKIELGRAQMLIENVLRLGSGSVVELDKLAGDPVDVFVNERLVARGEVIVLNENFCVRINEIVAGVEEEELV